MRTKCVYDSEKHTSDCIKREWTKTNDTDSGYTIAHYWEILLHPQPIPDRHLPPNSKSQGDVFFKGQLHIFYF